MKFLFALAMILVILVILVYTAAAKGAGSWENRPAAIPAEALEYGFINRQGDFVIKPEYQHAWPFSEGVGMVSNTKELLFLNTEGKTLFTLPAEVVRITPSRFASGLSALDDHGLVYIDKSGQPVIKTQYGAGGWFVDGVAPVMVQSEWGFIDKTGHVLGSPTP